MSWYVSGYSSVSDEGDTYEFDEDFNVLTSENTGYDGALEQTSSGEVYVGDSSGTLYKLDSDLNVVWEYSAIGNVQDIVWDDSRVYIATYDYAAIEVVDASDGSLVWDEYGVTNIGGRDYIRAITIDPANDWVYLFPHEYNGPSYINKYDATDGTLLEDAQYTVPGGGWGFNGMNYYEEEGLLIGADGEGYWVSADVSDGTLPSSLNGGDQNGSSYAYVSNRIDSNGELFHSNRDGVVTRFDTEGNAVWTVSTSIGSRRGYGSSVDQDYVLALGQGDGALKLDKADGSELDSTSEYSEAGAAMPRYDVEPDAWGSAVEAIEATPIGATASMSVPVESLSLSSTQTAASSSMAATSLDWAVAIDATPATASASMSTPSLETLDVLTSTQASVSASMNAPVESLSLSSTQATATMEMAATSLDWHSVVEASVSTISVSMNETSLDWRYTLRAAQSSAVASMNPTSVIGADIARAAHATAQASMREGFVDVSTSASPFTTSALMNRAGIITEIGAGRFTATGLMNNARSGKARFRRFGEKTKVFAGDSASKATFGGTDNDSETDEGVEGDSSSDSNKAR